MRLSLRLSAVAAAVVALAVTAAESTAQEYVVGSQVVSDQAVGNGCATGDCGNGSAGVAGAQGGVAAGARTYGNPDLFYNYYTQGYANSVNAQMYLAPLPVPPNVGHTFYTYPPLMPEHYLYWHKDRYHNHYDGGRGLNRTRAVYYAPPIKTGMQNIYWNFLRLPR